MSNQKHAGADTGSARAGDLHKLTFYLGRCYYAYVALLRRLIAETELDRHLRPGQGNVLFALFEQEGRTLGEICDHLGIVKSTMTSVVQQMVDTGVVRTEPDPRDGRAKTLWLTELGRSLRPQCMEVTRELESALCGDLSPEEQERLKGLLDGMLARLKDAVERRDR